MKATSQPLLHFTIKPDPNLISKLICTLALHRFISIFLSLKECHVHSRLCSADLFQFSRDQSEKWNQAILNSLSILPPTSLGQDFTPCFQNLHGWNLSYACTRNFLPAHVLCTKSYLIHSSGKPKDGNDGCHQEESTRGNLHLAGEVEDTTTVNSTFWV